MTTRTGVRQNSMHFAPLGVIECAGDRGIGGMGKNRSQSSLNQDRSYWDRMAPQWKDEIFNTLLHDHNRIILTEIEKAAARATSVADFGCGVGTYLPVLSRLFKDVHGLDHSQACIDLARKKVRAKSGVTLHVAGSAPTSLRGRFDVVLCVNAAIAPNRRVWHGVLKSAISLLNPRGTLILVVPSIESADLIEKAERDNLPTDAPKESRAQRRRGVVNIDGVPTKHFSRNELTSILGGQGLNVHRMRRVEYSWRSQSVKPHPELRFASPWDWLTVAQRT